MRAAAVALAALLAALSAAGRAQEEPEGCAIAGRFVLPHVRLRTIDGERPRRPRFVDLDAEAVLAPAIDGRHELSGTLPDGRAFTARLRALPRLEVRDTVRVPGVVLGAGVRVTDVHAGSPPGFDLELAPGVHLRDVAVPCASLAPAADRPRDPTVAFPAELGPARRPARARLILTDARGATLLRVRLEPGVVLHELERRGSRVRVAWVGGRARLEGWLEEPDLVPSEALDSLGRPR